MLYSVSPTPPLLFSYHISETGSVSDTSTTRFRNFEPAYTNLAHDFVHHSDYCYSREFPSPLRRYDAHSLDQHLAPSSALSQSIDPRDRADQHPPSTAAHSIIYTDDAGLKPCGRIRRWCFNCKATTTTTWRRSTLNPGKIVGSYIVLDSSK